MFFLVVRCVLDHALSVTCHYSRFMFQSPPAICLCTRCVLLSVLCGLRITVYKLHVDMYSSFMFTLRMHTFITVGVTIHIIAIVIINIAHRTLCGLSPKLSIVSSPLVTICSSLFAHRSSLFALQDVC